MYFTLLMNFVIPILHSERSDILHSSFINLSDSYRIQTYNLLIRSQMLYSVELTSHHL